MATQKNPSQEAVEQFTKRRGLNEEQARLRPTESGAQAAVEGGAPIGAEHPNPPDPRSEAKSELNNAEATPGTGILPNLDDDDPNMQPSS